MLRGFAERGGTVLISSHVLAEIAQTVDQVVIIAGGRFVAQQSLDELTASTASVRIRTPQRDLLMAHLQAAGLTAQPLHGDELLVTATAEEVGRLAASHGIVVLEMADEAPSLEDVFLDLTHRPGTGDSRDRTTAR